jgi:alkylated DNA repair dioxygenase AlkB
MSAPPIVMINDFVKDHTKVFDRLWNELEWVHRGNTPRLEYYCNDIKEAYTYGSGAGVRSYEVQPWHDEILKMRDKLADQAMCSFEVCFLNGYRDGSDQLGWHADDSPEMDDQRPIGIISLGARREIYFRPQDDKEDVTRVWLEPGSLCLMKAGMQDTHYHRIPKASYSNCGPRVSLTFRGYVNP